MSASSLDHSLLTSDDDPMDEPAVSEDYDPKARKKVVAKKKPAAKKPKAAKAAKATSKAPALKAKAAGVKKAPKASGKPKKVQSWEPFVSASSSSAPPGLFANAEDLDEALDELAEAGNEELSEAIEAYRTHMEDRGDAEDPLACFVEGGVRSTPFQVAAKAIVSRFRNVKATTTVWNKLVAACDKENEGVGVHPDAVLGMSEEKVIEICGNQRGEQVYAVAQAFADEGYGEDGDGADDEAYKALSAMPEAELMDKKSWIHSAKGIGETTMFTILVRALGRADVLPLNDGLLTKFLQKHKLFYEDDSDGKLDGNAAQKRLAAKTISEATEMWKPNRGLAAKLIWSQVEGAEFW